MNVDVGVGARDTIHREWVALRTQFDRLALESAHLCETARQLSSDAAEGRVRFHHDRRRRAEATLRRLQ